LKILITNTDLFARAGTELYVRDLAPALARQGHQVAVYSNVLGEVAQETVSPGVPVFSTCPGFT
jgi:ADP-dependent phosphofructokinase/glucokinase